MNELEYQRSICAQPGNTLESAEIRAERQRERADKWQEKYQNAQNEIKNIEKKYSEEIERIKKEKDNEFQKEIEFYKRSEQSARDRCNNYESKLGKTLSELYIVKSELNRSADFIKIGKIEDKKRKKAAKKRKFEKLVNTPAFDKDGKISEWVRRALKYGQITSIDVILSEKENKKPELLGKHGYYTTPSGKTVVTYPSAYKWRTVYHCSTLRIEVGRKWIEKNIKKIAMARVSKTKLF